MASGGAGTAGPGAAISELLLERCLEILDEACSRGSASNVSFLDILSAYDRCCTRHDPKSGRDTALYKFILKLSLNPARGWYEKLAAELQVREGEVRGRGLCFSGTI